MADNPFLGDTLRPDQQKWASTHIGFVSPLWLPFIAAAGVGAAWWTMTHWARVMGSGYPGAAGSAAKANGSAPQAPAPTPQPAYGAAASLAPEAEKLEAGLAEQPAAAALSDNLAVQGDDAASAAPAARQAQPAQPKPRPAAKASPAPQPAPAPKPAAAPKPKAAAAAPAASDDDDKPAPTLPPHEGLPARKKSGGGKKKNG